MLIYYALKSVTNFNYFFEFLKKTRGKTGFSQPKTFSFFNSRNAYLI